MNNDLKKVGLVLTAEGAVDFKKTLQEVNIELNKSYNQFKLTQAQWDKSTSSTEKLVAEQKYLKDAYEAQTDKVNILKMQLSELENAEEKNYTAIKKKRNELTNAEAKLATYNNRLKEIESQLNNTGKKIEEFGKKVEKVGGKIEQTGKIVSKFSAATATAFVATAKSAIDFEDAFTGVEKTVDGTAEQMEELKKGIRNMAKEIPSSTTEISAVAEAAGQLGIKTENILSFSKAMIDLGNSTNLSADEAASQLAKFANIMQMSQSDFNRLGSSIVELGNNFATTEADIVSMSMRLAGAGKQVGLSEGQVLGLATALSSVGIEAEMGGSAISKAMVKMQTAVENGGENLNKVLKKTGMSLRELELLSSNNSKDFKELCNSIGMTSTEVKNLITAGTNLEDFAKISGMTAEEFKKAWKKDATGALTAFIKGLGNAEEKGESAITMLTDMGLTEVRLRDSLLRAANAGNLFNDAIETGTKAWEDNTALTNEANKRYDTLKSKISILLNNVKDLSITFGNKLMPTIEKGSNYIKTLTDKIGNLTDEQVEFILKCGAAVIAIGPLLTIIGKITTVGGTAIKTIGTFSQAIGVMQGKITPTSTAVTGLAKVLTFLSNPATIACTAIAGVAIASELAEQKIKNSFSNMGKSANDFVNGINTAEGYLKNFNSTLFASSEEQQELQNNMNEVQDGITEICKRAADERRGYTEEEINQLNEYFEKLRNLKNREIEIQSQVAGAITQQAQSTAENFQGSLEEYKVQSQEWIKTAREQKDATVKLIEEGTIQEVALLNQRYSTEEERQSEAYTNEYNAIMEQKQNKIDVANDEVKKVTEIYANGYAERANQDGDFYEHLQHYNWEQEQEEQQHNKNLESIKENRFLTESNKLAAIRQENERHNGEISDIWKSMYKNMSESEANQLGIWLAMVAETQMYGGQISDEAQVMVDNVLSSYDSMPEDTREKMKQAMDPMLDEMNRAEPTLFAKATRIAGGIVDRLKKAFDEHSPSKETRKIMKFAMQPMEEEMDKSEKKLFKKADRIGEGLVDKFKNIDIDSNLIPDGNYNISKNEWNVNYEFIGKSIANELKNIIDYEKLTESLVIAISKLGIYLDKNAIIGAITPGVSQNMAIMKLKEERGS